METIYHSRSTECPPGKCDIIPLLDGNEVVGICCQRCGKRVYEQKKSTMFVSESGQLRYYPFTVLRPLPSQGRDRERS